jgi:polyphosphate kinase 2 (PPK2 family)
MQCVRIKREPVAPAIYWDGSIRLEVGVSEREFWPKYVEAYEDVITLTSTKRAPWYIIPSDHKWFRNLAVSQIIADTMDEMGLKLPPTHVDIAAIRRKFHAAERDEKGRT